jgi:hypothetical protein
MLGQQALSGRGHIIESHTKLPRDAQSRGHTDDYGYYRNGVIHRDNAGYRGLACAYPAGKYARRAVHGWRLMLMRRAPIEDINDNSSLDLDLGSYPRLR